MRRLFVAVFAVGLMGVVLPGSALAQTRTGSEALAESLAGVKGEGPALLATIRTSLGDIQCQLRPDLAPRGVATFVGLAMGTRRFIHHKTRKRMKARFYDGLSFHRVIPQFGIQGGDPRGNGTGGPGFVEPIEISPGLNHDHPGVLSMVSTGKKVSVFGSQFFISEKAQPYLNGKQTVIGRCENLDVVRKIARVEVTTPNRPVKTVTLIAVDVRRGPALTLPKGK